MNENISPIISAGAFIAQFVPQGRFVSMIGAIANIDYLVGTALLSMNKNSAEQFIIAAKDQIHILADMLYNGEITHNDISVSITVERTAIVNQRQYCAWGLGSDIYYTDKTTFVISAGSKQFKPIILNTEEQKYAAYVNKADFMVINPEEYIPKISTD